MKPTERRAAGDRRTVRPRSVPITSAATARSYVRSVVEEHRRVPSGPAGERAVMDLLLVVSEAVTNAIRHGGGLAGFEVALLPEGVRLSVHDYSDAVPSAAYGPGTLPHSHEGSGYGWPLIIRLSREIHIERRRAGGKTVTVLVPLT
ncbi:ATP-binding protein [Streptomyces caeruleatus]|uniref:ATP-binding protein n=1 Tax=Streptomyces caeruleatus TaxID=661399 RepID=UPI00099E33DC|nr:ATP-binding protein [Streptomyces caeruleatus]